MSKVLYIKANIKKEGESRTFRISDNFVEEYKKNNPQDEITILDLYEEKIDFLRLEDLETIFGDRSKVSKEDSILKYAYQFAEADKYIISSPMWNLSIPAILKAYIDYISVTGVTFKYTVEGPVGLLQNKKAVHIVTRGGEYENTPYEMGDKYLRTILGFFGVLDIETIAVENIDVLGINTQEKVQNAIEKAKLIAEKF